MKKEQIENILGRKLSDWEFEFFNKVLQAKREGKQLICYPARMNNRTRFKKEADILKTITNNQVFYDEFIDNVSNNKLNGDY